MKNKTLQFDIKTKTVKMHGTMFLLKSFHTKEVIDHVKLILRRPNRYTYIPHLLQKR